MINYKIIKSSRRKHLLITNDNVYYYALIANDNVYYYANLPSNTYTARNVEFRTVEEGKCYYMNDRYVLCCEDMTSYVYR